ncbi:MAG: ribosome-associated translation inhibitor RaiA [Lentisphaerae bacterium]|jgi:putative sigma-54 modulation protein|nr:ribosome-associated translation inhibitor RaiA [Lentisphaerota bacterium]
MQIEVTARHVSVNAELQARAQAKAEALLKEFPKIEHIHIVLDRERSMYVVEYAVQHKRVPIINGSDTNENMITASDNAYNKVWSQLRKHYDKLYGFHRERSTIREPNA